MICHHCQGEIIIFADFGSLFQVTSDCRPWKNQGQLGVCSSCGTVQKPMTEEWLKEANDIYSGYEIYSQSGGIEQSTFDQGEGASLSRSSKIVQWLSTTQLIPKNGKLLDIGCGNGAFLKAFGKEYSEWEMMGLELDSRSKDIIESIPGVVKLHIGPIDELNERFDLIVLVHALEHITNPIEYLHSLKKYLNPGGLLFIEVPDLENSPFDILIADHSTHFVDDILDRVVKSAGFETLVLKSDFVPKELSLLANVSANDTLEKSLLKESFIKGTKFAEEHIKWLKQLVRDGENVEGQVGIFGTSISATWLTLSLGDKVAFFIDEDVNRVGHTHMGREIYGIDICPEDIPVLMPLRIDIANSIKNRLDKTNLKLVLPSA